MYLSKVLPYKQRKYSKNIDHRLIMRGFPFSEEKARKRFNVLYRLEPQGFAIVQSVVKPDWSHCLPTGCVQSKEYEIKLVDGGQYRFRMAFNSIARNNGHEKPIHPIDWLKKRDLGAELNLGSIHCDQTIDRSGRNRVLIHRAVVDGLLTVTNLGLFTEHIVNGVGRSRGYGCGLISVILDS